MELLGIFIYYCVGFIIGSFLLCREIWDLNVDDGEDRVLCLGVIPIFWLIFLIICFVIYLLIFVKSIIMYIFEKTGLPTPIDLIHNCREKHRK